MTTETPLICPRCSEDVPDDSIWLHQDRYYCSEECVVEHNNFRRRR